MNWEDEFPDTRWWRLKEFLHFLGINWLVPSLASILKKAGIESTSIVKIRLGRKDEAHDITDPKVIQEILDVLVRSRKVMRMKVRPLYHLEFFLKNGERRWFPVTPTIVRPPIRGGTDLAETWLLKGEGLAPYLSNGHPT